MNKSPNPFIVDADTLTGQVAPVRRAALSLGSNLGDRLDNLQGALDSLLAAPDLSAVAVSSVYDTDPVGGPPQENYLNVVVVLETSLSARTLLERAQAVEDAFGRVRETEWGPRTLDVDLLAMAGTSRKDPDLQLPHPRLQERAFVLVPWAEIDPDFVVPGLGRVKDLAARLPMTAGVRRTGDILLLPG